MPISERALEQQFVERMGQATKKEELVAMFREAVARTGPEISTTGITNIWKQYEIFLRELEIKEQIIAELRSEHDCGVVTVETTRGETLAIVKERGLFSLCGNGADFVAEKYGGEVVGFFTEDNPVESREIMEAEGHDFALIANRFVVDPWIVFFVQEDSRILLDLRDPEDRQEITRRYGHASAWERRDGTKVFGESGCMHPSGGKAESQPKVNHPALKG